MSEEEQPISQQESQANHDAWWDSLTNDEKEKLYNDMAESEATYYGSKLKQTANEMLEAIKNIKGN